MVRETNIEWGNGMGRARVATARMVFGSTGGEILHVIIEQLRHSSCTGRKSLRAVALVVGWSGKHWPATGCSNEKQEG